MVQNCLKALEERRLGLASLGLKPQLFAFQAGLNILVGALNPMTNLQRGTVNAGFIPGRCQLKTMFYRLPAA